MGSRTDFLGFVNDPEANGRGGSPASISAGSGLGVRQYESISPLPRAAEEDLFGRTTAMVT